MNRLFSPEIQHAVRTHGWAKLRAATRRRIREAEEILRQPIAATAGGPPVSSQSSFELARMKRRLQLA